MFKRTINPKSIFSRPGFFPDYKSFETLKEARVEYKTLTDCTDLHSASITKILKSTDYF
jgi:hypothetical protein